MQHSIEILGIAGSLRRNSYNKALLRAAQQLAPSAMIIKIYEDLGSIPPYNSDVEAEAYPEVVKELKQRIRAADGVLIVTPEYNYGLPGVLKNAIDWASRPYGDSAWEGKPLAIMGASPGQGGTVRAQLHLRQAAIFLNMLPLNRPEVIVTSGLNGSGWGWERWPHPASRVRPVQCRSSCPEQVRLVKNLERPGEADMVLQRLHHR